MRAGTRARISAVKLAGSQNLTTAFRAFGQTTRCVCMTDTTTTPYCDDSRGRMTLHQFPGASSACRSAGIGHARRPLPLPGSRVLHRPCISRVRCSPLYAIARPRQSTALVHQNWPIPRRSVSVVRTRRSVSVVRTPLRSVSVVRPPRRSVSVVRPRNPRIPDREGRPGHTSVLTRTTTFPNCSPDASRSNAARPSSRRKIESTGGRS